MVSDDPSLSQPGAAVMELWLQIFPGPTLGAGTADAPDSTLQNSPGAKEFPLQIS